MSQLKNNKTLIDALLEVLLNVNLVSGKIGDSYFSGLLSEELSSLLSNFIEFQKAPSKTSFQELYSGTDRLMQLSETFHHAGKIDKLDLLHILRSGYRFKTLVFESKNSFQNITPPLKLKNETVDKFISVPKQAVPKYAVLNPIKKDLLGIIKTKKEVLNLDLFALMPNLTKRSIKRHLSELIHAGYVSRKSLGKKVYYTSKDKNMTAN